MNVDLDGVDTISAMPGATPYFLPSFLLTHSTHYIIGAVIDGVVQTAAMVAASPYI